LRALARTELDLAKGDVGINSIELVRCLILRREAWQKIEGSSPPDDPWWHLQYGRVHARLDDPDKAIQEFEAGIAARPDDPQVALACARTLGQLGMGDRALANLAQLIARNPNDARASIARGHLLAERGEH
jgi:predicted Zn-dependent protease